MTYEDMCAGFAEGRSLTQEEWSQPAEIAAVDRCAAEGRCTVSAWKWDDNFQCEKRRAVGIIKTA